MEEASIYAIQCSSKPGKIYYIYQFFRDDGRATSHRICTPFVPPIH